MNKRRPELLSPAGDPEKLRYAVAYGADAVYLGGDSFSLRAASKNFSLEEIGEAVRCCRERGKKVYVAVNVFPREDELAPLKDYLARLNEIGPDALLVADPGVFSLARAYAPDLPLHISTQANNVNSASAEFWRGLGARRVVLGRELSLGEIRALRRKTDMELELFVHGAMCVSYSGRCLLSAFLSGRDGNRGRCSHPCRWRYALAEASRPDQYFPIEEDDGGSYILNSKDLCLLPYLPELIDAGIDSLKIEGRVKSLYYTAVVTDVYRRALDDLFADKARFEQNLPDYMEALCSVSHRQYCSGFLTGPPDADAQRYETSAYVRRYDFIALVKGYDAEKGRLLLEQRNHFAAGEELEIVSPGAPPRKWKPEHLYDEEGGVISAAPHAQMRVAADCAEAFPAMSIVRRKRSGA